MLTELAIRKLTARGCERVEIWDDKLPGFGVRVSPAGTKSFVVMYYRGGRKQRVTLGRYPLLPLSEARALALATLAAAARGDDPKRMNAAGGRGFGFTEVVKKFVDGHSNRHNREGHARETERLLQARFGREWGDTDVRKIEKKDVLAVLDRTVNAGAPSAANHALSAVRKFFTWCLERGLIEANPCEGISRPASERSRDRVLTLKELGIVWNATLNTAAPFSQIVQLLVLTLQRRGEVAGVRWSEIDWENATWLIPAQRTKSDRAQHVPLSALAVSVLRSVPRIHDTLVFPARGNKGTIVSGFSKMKRQLDRVADISDWTLHDLRRTGATHMAEFGVAPHVIERILNHTTGTLGGVAGIYNRFQYLPEMRNALELWAKHVSEIATA